MNNFQLEPVTQADDRILTANYQTRLTRSRTVIVRLEGDEKFLIYSPGEPLLEQAQTIIARDADVILVAPSQGHTLGIASWLEAYPKARLVTTEKTIETLKQQNLTEIDHIEPEDFQQELPQHIAMFRVPDCSMEEIWVTVTADNRTYWLVCDGVMNLSAYSENFLMSLFQRLYGLRRGLWITPIFIRNLADRGQFKIWFNDWLGQTRQPILIPCHGEIYRKQDLTERLLELMEKRL